MPRILLIDDDDVFCEFLQDELQKHGCDVTRLDCAEPGVQLLSGPAADIDAVLLDNKMPGMSGIEFLEEVRRQGLQVPVILITGHFTPDVKIPAYKLGVHSYFTKPLEFDDRSRRELHELIRKSVEISRLSKDQVWLPNDPGADAPAGIVLLGNSEPMEQVWQLVGAAARDTSPVLLIGETGTGKDLVARALFHYGNRAGPFLKVRCEPSARFAEELFGYKSADGTHQSAGVFEQADRGAVLLDDISNTTPAIQARILQMMEQQSLPSGQDCTKATSNVWIIATSHYDLRLAAERGEFDASLYYQLTPIRLPPLQERASDIELLAKHFLARYAEAEKQPVHSFEQRAFEKLRRYHWPGNVWELEKVVRLAVLKCSGPQVLAADISLDLEAPGWEAEIVMFLRRAVSTALRSGQADLRAFLGETLERELLLRGWEETNHNVSDAAGRLGVAPGFLEEKLRDLLPHGLPEDTRTAESESLGSDARPSRKNKAAERRARAYEVIPNCPLDWILERIAQEIGCAKATLFRDPFLKGLLDLRRKERENNKKRWPRGEIGGNGDVDGIVE